MRTVASVIPTFWIIFLSVRIFSDWPTMRDWRLSLVSSDILKGFDFIDLLCSSAFFRTSSMVLISKGFDM